MVTAVNFTGRCFDSGWWIGQEVVSTVISALASGFFVLLNSHGKPHVLQTSDIKQMSAPEHSYKTQLQTSGILSFAAFEIRVLEHHSRLIPRLERGNYTKFP